MEQNKIKRITIDNALTVNLRSLWNNSNKKQVEMEM